MKKKVYDYDLHVNGLFGRNRKEKRHMFTLAKRLDAPLPPADAIELARKELERIKLHGSFALYERVGEIENMSGVDFYTTALKFGAKPFFKGHQLPAPHSLSKKPLREEWVDEALAGKVAT